MHQALGVRLCEGLENVGLNLNLTLVDWLIVLGLVTLLVIWWRGYLTWPINAGDRSPEPATRDRRANRRS